MKILGIHIYGFGKHHDLKIDFRENMQVFYGKNEAGKSTIMAFILAVLFGFPTKQQSAQRYEPKDHSSYGGIVRADFPAYGTVVIERTRGKSAGDVTVTMKDGRIGGQEMLDELLSGLDRSTCQSIFSFNLQGLQNIQQLKGEDLGRYLFSAGTLGSDRLLQAENKLHKEMEERFKQGGKKPRINQKLAELKEMHEKLRKAQGETKEYSELLAEKSAIEKKIAEAGKSLDLYEEQAFKLREMNRLSPEILEAAAIKSSLQETGDIPFPHEGLRRLERNELQLQPVEARLSWLKEQKLNLEEEKEKFRPDISLLEREAEIEYLFENLFSYEQNCKQVEEAREHLLDIQEKIAQGNDSLHANFSDETIHLTNTSSELGKQAEALQKTQLRLAEWKQRLEAEFRVEKASLEELERESAVYEKRLLPDDEKAKLVQQLNDWAAIENQKEELLRIEGQAEVRQQRHSNENKGRQKKNMQQWAILAAVLFYLILGIWSAATGRWELIAIAALGGLPVLFMYYTSRRERPTVNPSGSAEESWMSVRQRELRKAIDQAGELDAEEIRRVLNEHEKNLARYMELKGRLDLQNTRYERVILQFEDWENETMEAEQLNRELCARMRLGQGGHMAIYDAYVIVSSLKQLFREKQRTQERLKALEQKSGQQLKEYKGIAQEFLGNPRLSVRETCALMKKKLMDERGKRQRYEEAISKLAEIEEELGLLLSESAQLHSEKEILFELAGVKDAEAYRLLGEKAAKAAKLQERAEVLEMQLKGAGITEEDCEKLDSGSNPALELESLSLQIDHLKVEQKEMVGKLAEIKHSLSMLEEGLYSDLLHQYSMMKYEFREEAKEWAALALAKELLGRTVELYRKERLPKMLKRAEEFLSSLTGGEYERIIPEEKGAGFFIERKDHRLFTADELSQATSEQVYVAIRLSLAEALQSRCPFPIIIDDGFVNFDEVRTARTISLLRSLDKNQVLFFTCHDHLLEHFSQPEIFEIQNNKTMEKTV